MPIRTVVSPSVPILVLSLAACGGGPSGPSSNPEDLVDTWLEVPSSFETGPGDQLVITDDHRFELRDPDGGVEIGTWSADEHELTFEYTEDTETVAYRTSYVIEGNKLMTAALFPDGEVDGAAGTWRGDVSIGSLDATMTVTLNGDGTAHYEVDRSVGDDDDRTGTWRHDGADVVVSFEEPLDGGGTITVNVHFQELPGIAIGGPMYQR